MKLRLVYLLFFGALLTVVLAANKNGRASEAKKGNTGAPGDETNANGSPRTCTYCHFGAAGPVVFIHLLNAIGDTVTQYLPGQQYTARVSIQNSNSNLTGYGFQMIALRAADSTDLHGFSDPGNNTVNNYKLATIANGRTYAEHDNVSASTQFNVVWTAPQAGAGSVTFFAAGNAVNRNGTTSGDGASSGMLQIQEGLASATTQAEEHPVRLNVWPNPVAQTARMEIVAEQAEEYRFRVFDCAGRVVWQSARQLPPGRFMLDVPVAGWTPGIYFLEATTGTARRLVKVLK
ncbi:MAG: T9SS type A sorting domain-containing protein [Saprospirales bacterium]|nr:T9SS type A sorting domain-containing protein [Saprospirales bacterium]